MPSVGRCAERAPVEAGRAVTSPTRCTGVDPGDGPREATGATADQEAHCCAVMFVELDTRHNDGYTVSLEWNRDTGNTRIVVADGRDESLLVFWVPGADAGDAFRHPFRYAP